VIQPFHQHPSLKRAIKSPSRVVVFSRERFLALA
jgi:hypothetical protein